MLRAQEIIAGTGKIIKMNWVEKKLCLFKVACFQSFGGWCLSVLALHFLRESRIRLFT